MSHLPEVEMLTLDSAEERAPSPSTMGWVMLRPQSWFGWRVESFGGDEHETQLTFDRCGYVDTGAGGRSREVLSMTTSIMTSNPVRGGYARLSRYDGLRPERGAAYARVGSPTRASPQQNPHGGCVPTLLWRGTIARRLGIWSVYPTALFGYTWTDSFAGSRGEQG